MGIEVIEQDLETIIDRLQHVGRAEDIALARRIGQGWELQVKIHGLSPAERDTLLGALDDTKPGRLSELRGKLARDHRDRA